MRILVVEDNAGDQQLIAHSLKRALHGVEILLAGDADEAMALLRERSRGESARAPDLVLLDLNLPGRSGVGVLQELKADRRLRRIPVFVLSSSNAPEDVGAAYDNHAAAYFTKPLASYDELASGLAAFVGLSRLPELAPDEQRRSVAEERDPRRTTPPPLLFEQLVRSSADAILSTDLEGNITSWNEAAERMYGYSADEAIGRNVRLIVPEERLAELQRLLDGVRGGDSVKHFETERVDRDGTLRTVGLTLSPILDRAGAVVGKSAVARDLTAHRAAEDRFRLAVESSPNAMVMVDEAGGIVMVNAEAERLFGYSRAELLGQPVELLVPRRYGEAHPGHRTSFFREPEARAMGAGRDLTAVRKDGREFPVEIGLNPIRTAEGTFVLSAVVDITERKQAEERFRVAVESSPSGMVMVDHEGKILMVNAEAERLFGYSRAELLGSSIDQLVPARFRGQHHHHRRAFQQSPAARAMGAGRDLHGVHRNGSEFPVEIGLNPIATPDGDVVLCTVVDITERKHAEDELTRQAQELARSNADLEQFAYVASHDLQEPLRMVASFTQLLEREYADRLDDTGRTYIQFTVDGATRMQKLIHDLLGYARLSMRTETAKEVDLGRALAVALENLGLGQEPGGPRVDVGPLPTVIGVAHQFVALFQNLVGNAIKFRGDAPPEVEIRSVRDGNFHRISVTDNGAGIAPEHHEDVFQLFRRLHTRSECPGTGMGLAICKRIVERHGGSIWLESTPGRGTTFYVRLPKMRASTSPD